jgi:hypothetical protein
MAIANRGGYFCCSKALELHIIRDIIGRDRIDLVPQKAIFIAGK